MTTEISLVLCAIVLLALVLLWWRRRGQDAPSCATCRHFSLEGGQQALANSGAFAGAAQVLEPWKMAEPRRIEWSPEYKALEKELEEAIEERDHRRKLEIHDKIQELGNLGREVPPEEYVSTELLELSWQDFGTCSRHRELRARTDCCPHFARERSRGRRLTVVR